VSLWANTAVRAAELGAHPSLWSNGSNDLSEEFGLFDSTAICGAAVGSAYRFSKPRTVRPHTGPASMSAMGTTLLWRCAFAIAVILPTGHIEGPFEDRGIKVVDSGDPPLRLLFVGTDGLPYARGFQIST